MLTKIGASVSFYFQQLTMQQKHILWKDYHHQLYQIYHAVIAITLMPFALLFLEWDSGNKSSASMQSPLFLLVAQVLWVVGFVSWYVWKGSKVQYQFSDEMTILSKMKEFKQKNVWKFLLLTLGGLLAAFAMWIQPSFVFVIAYFLILVQYSFLRPSEDKFVRDMRLTKHERKQLHAENA